MFSFNSLKKVGVMKKLFYGILLFTVLSGTALAGTLMTTKTDSGATIQITDKKGCYIDGGTHANMYVAWVVDTNGEMESGCYIYDDSTDNVVINWGEGRFYSYSVNSFTVTKYGRDSIK